MSDPFAGHLQGLDSPSRSNIDLDASGKSDTTDLTTPLRAIYVGATGNVKVLCIDDTSPVIYQAVPAGSVIRGRFKRVYSTLTTATGLVGQV